MPSDESPVKSGGISADLLKRTSALKESLDNDWKSRVAPSDHVQLRRPNDTIRSSSVIQERATSLTYALQEDWKNRVPNPDDPILRVRTSGVEKNARQSLQVFEAREKLRQAGESWTRKIDDKSKDAAKFTVAAKLGQVQSNSPFEGSHRPQAPVRKAFRPSTITSSTSEESFIRIEETETELRKRIVLDFTSTKSDKMESTSIDAGIDSFFASSQGATETAMTSVMVLTSDPEAIEFVLDDFPAPSAAPLLTGVKRNLPKMARKAPTAKNPVKADLVGEAAKEEMSSAVLEKVKVQSNAKMNPGSVKLAALTARVDFSAAARAILSMGSKAEKEREIAPKLILIKGRRHVQVRLVEPFATSLNDGDSYVLTSPNEVFVLTGEYSNKIETTKALEVAQEIVHMHDFGVKAEAAVTRLPMKNLENPSRSSSRVLDLLQWSKDAVFRVPASGPAEEDEEYEIAISTTNKVYELSLDGTLEPVDAAWGINPSRAILSSDKKLVMDFGCEVYVWLGKHVEMSDRKRAKRAGESLLHASYDYDGCFVTPFDGGAESKTPKSCAHRPFWTHFARVPQGRESILLRSKFFDWGETFAMNSKSPEEERKENRDKGPTMDPDALEMTDGEELLASHPAPIPFEIEKVDLERGEYVVDGYMRREVVTHGLAVFRVANQAQCQVVEQEIGQFFDEESYIVSWQFEARPITRRLDGRPSQLPQVSRIRKVELFWHGMHASIVDRGTAAAHVKKRVEDEGSQSLELHSGREPALFVRLFTGRMIIMRGQRGDGSFKPRMFIVLGEDFPECYALEVEVHAESLRSRGIFLIVTAQHVSMWIGQDATEANMEVARKIAKDWIENPPNGVVQPNTKLSIVKEGKEAAELKQLLQLKEPPCVQLPAIDGGQRPRVFHLHLCASTGAFSFEEIRSTFFGNPKFPRPVFPALQQNLYDKTNVPEGLVGQPGLFLIDNIDRIYLWRGVYENADDDRPDFLVLWNCTVKCAVLTMLSYGQEKKKICGRDVPMAVVTAGLEPPEFVQIFPRWAYDENARQIHLALGHAENELLSPEDVLALHKQRFYAIEELRAEQLPPGVIPRRREDYLSDEDFEDLFGMTKEDYHAMPEWKRIELKKKKNFF